MAISYIYGKKKKKSPLFFYVKDKNLWWKKIGFQWESDNDKTGSYSLF